MSAAGDTVSVVIPVYNGARYLAAAIDSVFAQSRPVDQVIVVDDGSADETPAVIAAYEARIVPLRQDNAGTASALNRGIAAARGTLLAFLDADDLWLPDKCERQLAVLDARPEIDMVFGWVQQFVSPELPAEAAARLTCPAEPQRGIGRTAMTIRRAAFDRVGCFDESLYAADFIDWYPRAREAGLLDATVEQVVTMRRLHTTNNGVRLRAAQSRDNLTAIKRMLDRRRGRG